MTAFNNFTVPFKVNPKYKKKVAYFSMEFGIDQALKTYSGGLGFLAGSHMRSAYDLKQNLIGVSILWKFGYYDQVRKPNDDMYVLFWEKLYSFLEDTGIQFPITVNGHEVQVRAFYLAPKTFGSAPLFFLSTALPENDHLAQTISHHLYDPNTEARIAQYQLLGLGGAKLLEELNFNPDTYHLNEAHGLAAAFHLYEKDRNIEKVKKQLVLTTHTPVEAGNDKHDIHLMHKMGFFGNLSIDDLDDIIGRHDGIFNYTLVGLRMAKMANGVSKIHGTVANEMWGHYEGICPITHITNSQNKKYWADTKLYNALEKDNNKALLARKKELKIRFFEEVADQTGKLFDPNALTIVWARRFAGYKRADILTKDIERFEKLVNDDKRPVQIIWAGKPYPKDYDSIDTFNYLVQLSKKYKRCAVLTGYELTLSKLMKQGSDIWLNTPRIPREASGTSGMTSAMNAGVNFSTYDGWIPEFAKHGVNAFVVPQADYRNASQEEQDAFDLSNLYNILENEIIPAYYDTPEKWLKIVKTSMKDVVPFFDSDRMANEYYTKLYNAKLKATKKTVKKAVLV